MFKVQEETTRQALEECVSMGASLQYEEIIAKKDKIKFNINTDLLAMVLEAGMVRLVTARDEDDKVIGYFVNLIETDFITSTLLGKEVAIFVHPNHRKSGVFGEMLSLQELIAKEAGAKMQMLEFQTGHSDDVPLGFDYRKVSTVWEKHLGE